MDMVFVARDDTIEGLAGADVLDAARTIEWAEKLADVERLGVIVKISLEDVAWRDIHSLPKVVLRYVSCTRMHIMITLQGGNSYFGTVGASVFTKVIEHSKEIGVKYFITDVAFLLARFIKGDSRMI